VGDPENDTTESPNHFDLPDLYNTTFSPKRPSLVWVKNGKKKIKFVIMYFINAHSFFIDPRDGIFTYTDPNTNDILLESVETGKTEIFVEASNLVSYKSLRQILFILIMYLENWTRSFIC
jgi:hypothetical protein